MGEVGQEVVITPPLVKAEVLLPSHNPTIPQPSAHEAVSVICIIMLCNFPSTCMYHGPDKTGYLQNNICSTVLVSQSPGTARFSHNPPLRWSFPTACGYHNVQGMCVCVQLSGSL